MSYQVILAERAHEDLRAIMRRMEKTNPTKLDDWHSDFWEAVGSLEELPARCSMIKEEVQRKGLRHLLFENYRLVFSIGDGVVEIARIRHQRQQPLTSDDL